jgi:hypothetical protein
MLVIDQKVARWNPRREKNASESDRGWMELTLVDVAGVGLLAGLGPLLLLARGGGGLLAGILLLRSLGGSGGSLAGGLLLGSGLRRHFENWIWG